MRIATYLVLATIMGLSNCGKTDTADKNNLSEPAAREVTVITSDSLTQTAWFTPSPEEGPAPLVIMLPMLGQTHESYIPFMEAINSYVKSDSSGRQLMVPSFLNFDLRGHGRSTTKGDLRLEYGGMSEADFARIPLDVKEMTERILVENAERIDTGFIVVVGASIGANAAIMLTEHIPFIRKVVLLSVGENYRGLKPGAAFKSFNGQTLIVTGRGDKYSYTSSNTLAKLKMENWVLKLYPMSEHGTDILYADSRPMSTVVSWIFEEAN